MAFNKALLSGSPAWSNGTPFDGYVLISIVLPNLGINQVTRVGMDGSYPNQRLPQRIRVPIKNGVFNDKTYIPFNSSLEPPNTQYEARWYDQFDNLITTNGAFFTVSATPHAITIPTLTAPTAGGVATPPDTNPTTTAAASYGEVTMGGDISGQSSAAQVDKIQGKSVVTAGVTDGQVLVWSAANSRFQPATQSGGGSTTLAGDVSGTTAASSVDKIKGTTVDAAAIGDGKLLKYTSTGTKLEYANLAGDVSGGVGTTAVDKIKGIPVASLAGILNGQILKYNSTTLQFEKGDDATGGTGGGVTMAGDVSGPNSASVVDKIKGVVVNDAGKANGKVLKYNSATLQLDYANDETGATPTLSGDVSGLATATTVDKIKGVPVAATTPTNGQVLKYNGASWAPAADSDTTAMAGDVTGTQAASVVAKIQGVNVAVTTPTNGQVLKYNGTAWAPGTDNSGSGAGGLSYSSVNNSVTLNNPTGLTTFDKTYSLGANVLANGTLVRITATINFATTSSAALNLVVRCGAAQIMSAGSPTVDTTAGVGKYASFSASFVCRAIGTSGVMMKAACPGFLFPTTTAPGTLIARADEGGTFNLDTTVANTIALQVSSAATSSSFILESLTIEVLAASATS